MPTPPASTAPSDAEVERRVDRVVESLGARLRASGLSIGVVESLTGGLVVQALARAEGSGDWLRGGVVAYHRDVKHDLIGVKARKVVSRDAALEMAAGARRSLGADVGVAVTGVAGPDPQDGEPPGTVWVGVATPVNELVRRLRLDGDPMTICEQTVEHALATCLTALDDPVDAHPR